MRLGLGILAAVSALTVTVTACSAPVPAPPPVNARRAVASQTPPPVHRIGTTIDVEGISVQLVQFLPRVRLDRTPDGPGNHWAAAKIKTCFNMLIPETKDYINVSWTPWSLIDSENGRWRAFDSGNAPSRWKSPVYPADNSRQVALGECVTGWVEFPVDDGVQVKHVRYTLRDRPAQTWRV